MSEKIKSSDIFEGDIFKIVVDSAELAKTKISELNEELVKVGTSFKKELKSVKTDNVKEINELIVKVKELTSAVETQTKVNKANEIAIREAKKTSEQALREEEKTKRDVLKTQEQINKADERALANKKKLSGAYKELSDNTRDLKNESKRLGAEMLELEKQGKKNSAEYYKLSKQYKETTKSAIEGDKALKKLDERVGDNFRKVGNYERVVNGLRLSLVRLGLSFGVFDGIRALIDTQVKLDSLNLALKNVSGSTKEYQANFAFLKDISLSYGQDLLVLMDTYKNFIASTSSSNLSLVERKRIYESVIKAGSALALSNDNVKGSLLAISQMFSKGTVSAEELRQQLGERLPGAFGIMAESMGVSEQELGKLMKNGQVLADEVMPRFAIMLERHFGANASERLKTLGGAWNVLKNNITLYFNEAQKNINVNKTLAYVISTAGKSIGTLLDNVRQLATAFIAFKALMIANSIRISILNEGFVTLIKNAIKGKQAITLFGISLKQIAFIAVLDGIVKMTDRFLDLAKGTDIARKAYENFQATTNKGMEKANNFLENLDSEARKRKKKADKDKKDGLINDKKYNEILVNIEVEREEKIQKRIRQLRASIGIGKEKADEIKDLFGGLSPTKLAQKARKEESFMNTLLRTLGFEVKSGDLLDEEFFSDIYQKIKGNTNDFANQLMVLQKRVRENEELKDKFKAKNEGSNKVYAEQDKALKEINTEYKTTTEYLSRHLELMADIEQFRVEERAIKAQEEYNKALEEQQRILENTGDYGISSMYYASEKEQEALLESEKKQFDARKLRRETEYKQKYDDLIENLDDEKKAKLKDVEEVEALIALKRKNAQSVLGNKTSSASVKQTAKDTLKWATEQENKLAIDKLAVEQNYQDAVRKIELEAKKEKKELDEEEANELEKLKARQEKIIRDSEERIAKDEEELNKKKAEMRLELIKQTAESVNNLIQKSLEHYINLAERRIDLLDKRMERMSTQADFLREKAVAGNIQAQESLAEIDKQQIEGEKQKLKEQKSIQKLQIAMTVLQAYSNNIQNAKLGQNPFTKTFTDITLLNQLINTVSNNMPAYFDGTEDTGTNGKGVDGKGGFHAILHPNERVIPKALNSKIGDLSNLEIAKLAEDFHRGEVMRKGEGAMQLNVNSWGADMIVSKLESLEQTIKNKPENQVEVAEILNGVMHIVETKKSGNTKVRNISRFS